MPVRYHFLQVLLNQRNMSFSRHRFLPVLLLIYFVISVPDLAVAEEEHAPRIACYTIDVKLDPQEKRLSGSEILTFMNTSSESVDTLFLHLYPNAFQSDTTTFMKESFFPDRVKRKERYRGFIRIERVTLSSGVDLTNRKIIDQTIMKLPLPSPLPPGKEIELEIEFVVKLPEILFRLGYSGEDFMIAQWFPKMAVLEKDGSWNAHQYHFYSEFFADFGTYDVSITVPLEYVVGATGYLVEEKEYPDSTKTLVYHAEDVHDFAWAASPDFRICQSSVEGIEVRFFYKPRHEKDVKRVMEEVEFGLKYYNSTIGRYPYRTFTLVDTRIGLGGGAMEYPTLITFSPSSLPPERIRLDRLILFHEIAHQWWYGMVASNEFEEAWLDEGFAVFFQRRALEERAGGKDNLVNLWGMELGDLDIARLTYLMEPQSDPVVKNSWEFRNYLSYRANVYSKASLVLESLRNHLGKKKMDELVKEYFRRYKFKHPKTSDFIQLVDEIGGEDLSYMVEQLLSGTGICDFEVTSIKSTPIKKGTKEEGYITEVVVRRLGEVIIPVEISIELEDGERMKEVWDARERWHKIEMKTDSKIKSAIIDPEGKIPLDVNINNNSLSTEVDDSVIMKLSTQCLFWLETMIHWMTCF